jgi:hypothetical protein
MPILFEVLVWVSGRGGDATIWRPLEQAGLSGKEEAARTARGYYPPSVQVVVTSHIPEQLVDTATARTGTVV